MLGDALVITCVVFHLLFILHFKPARHRDKRHTAMHKQTVTGDCEMFHNESDKFYLL